MTSTLCGTGDHSSSNTLFKAVSVNELWCIICIIEVVRSLCQRRCVYPVDVHMPEVALPVTVSTYPVKIKIWPLCEMYVLCTTTAYTMTISCVLKFALEVHYQTITSAWGGGGGVFFLLLLSAKDWAVPEHCKLQWCVFEMWSWPVPRVLKIKINKINLKKEERELQIAQQKEKDQLIQFR